MIDMGGGDIDGLEKSGQEMEAILGGADKLLVLGNLDRDTSASDDAMEKAITNLPCPGDQILQCNNSSPCGPEDTDHLQPSQELLLQKKP